VHVSNLASVRVDSPSDVVSRNQNVKVKIMSIAGSNYGLSMKDVDQQTGEDLSPHLRIKTREEMEAEQRAFAARVGTGSNAGPLGGGASPPPTMHVDPKRGSAKRLSSPERFEIKQLIASGAVSAADYPDLDDDFHTINNQEIDEEVDIEVAEKEPAFLAGQTKITLDISPVKIIKAPDGSMNRAALAGTQLAKERADMRRMEANEQADSQARNIAQPWLDPMAQQGDRQFASDVRQNMMNARPQAAPAWKSANKSMTFGRITTLSIQEQRRSLPIYKLRDQLVKAIREVSNLLCILTDRSEPDSCCGRRHGIGQDDPDGAVSRRGRPAGAWQARMHAAA
jgi:ATP-dependent RNA helicase DHX8/PRP22